MSIFKKGLKPTTHTRSLQIIAFPGKNKKKPPAIVMVREQTLFLTVVAFIAILHILLILTSRPDRFPAMMREQLAARGFYAEDILFERTSDWPSRVYRSSRPVDIGEGCLVELWEIRDVSISTHRVDYRLYPSPSLSWRIEKNMEQEGERPADEVR